MAILLGYSLESTTFSHDNWNWKLIRLKQKKENLFRCLSKEKLIGRYNLLYEQHFYTTNTFIRWNILARFPGKEKRNFKRFCTVYNINKNELIEWMASGLSIIIVWIPHPSLMTRNSMNFSRQIRPMLLLLKNHYLKLIENRIKFYCDFRSIDSGAIK